MSRRVPLPSEAEIREALAELSKSDANDVPTVVALAQSIGLANATFWRHFPQIAQEVADARRNAQRSLPPGAASPANAEAGGYRVEVTRLRREKSQLRDQLEAAVAHIMHLTLEHRALGEENQALRKALELERNVAQLPQR